MKVSQLIEALKQMPQDAEVLTHADNHTISEGESMRVGVATHVWGEESWTRVIVGNWNDHNLRCWQGTHLHLANESLAVLVYGDEKGELVKQRHHFEPKTTLVRTVHEPVEARWRMETVKP